MSENSATEKWTEITILPEWEEEYYNVYTARKFGKWVMLKTLKPEYKNEPQYQEMLDKEFEVRYNLAHSHIVMINDLEDVPGLGRCIITDDVYGDSLRKLINENRVTPEIIDKLRRQLVEAIEYIQANHIVHHPIRPETIIFTENIGNLKLIDVGFDQKNHLEPADAADDIASYGHVLAEALDHCQERFPHLRKVAERCMKPNPRDRYRDIQALNMALSDKSPSRLPIIIIVFLSIMILLLAWLNSSSRPDTPDLDSSSKHNTTITTECQ